jgi:hypothetical protein
MEPAQITALVERMADFILDYAIALAAVGALTMVLLEALKSLFRLREKYHYNELRKWIQAPGNAGDETWRQLIRLTTGDAPTAQPASLSWVGGNFQITYSNALFTLELEKMMGQIQAAADVVLDSPKQYESLYGFLTAGAARQDIDDWKVAADAPLDPKTGDAKKTRDVAQQYTRLNKYVRRRLDSFQLRTSFRWSSANQKWSVVVGAVIMFVALSYLEYRQSDGNLGVLDVLPFIAPAILGGAIAPMAKDLVVALRKVRSRG